MKGAQHRKRRSPESGESAPGTPRRSARDAASACATALPSGHREPEPPARSIDLGANTIAVMIATPPIDAPIGAADEAVPMKHRRQSTADKALPTKHCRQSTADKALPRSGSERLGQVDGLGACDGPPSIRVGRRQVGPEVHLDD